MIWPIRTATTPSRVSPRESLAAGTSNGQSTYDLRTFREWFGVPDLEPHEALLPFYGIESEADWTSDRVTKLMSDASAITHLTEDDVPVYMAYARPNVKVDANTDQGTWVHHVLLGLKLQEAMRELGLECPRALAGSSGEGIRHGGAVIAAKLKGKGAGGE